MPSCGRRSNLLISLRSRYTWCGESLPGFVNNRVMAMIREDVTVK